MGRPYKRGARHLYTKEEIERIAIGEITAVIKHCGSLKAMHVAVFYEKSFSLDAVELMTKCRAAESH